MAFTKGSEQEVAFLVDALGLQPGMRVLDAGCGPGRHAVALAQRKINVTGVDLSPEFIDLARTSAEGLSADFHVGDVRDLDYVDAFDAVICLCQGGFGLLGGGEQELAVMHRLAAACKPRGRLALSAFSSYFVVRHLETDRGERFDADTAVNYERTTVRDDTGREREFDLWTTCYTPRELRLLAARAQLEVDAVYGVTPGRYARERPSLDVPEFLLLAHKPAGVSPPGADL
jgi:2-polyprenyl-3-methyl-5-hydroxy-6-metoxy-1,4-benzoquinol methylase